MPNVDELTHNCRDDSDEDLVRKSLQNIEYFACLFNRYEKKLLFYVKRISSFDNEEAEEVLQEAFIKIWENLNEFDDSLKFSSWAYRIVHNHTISVYKKSQSFDKDKKQNFDEELFVDLPSELDLPQELNKKIDSKQIHNILNLLPEKYSSILVLKFLEGKNYDEISDILKKPSGTVATLINRAKAAFKEAFQRQNIQVDF